MVHSTGPWQKTSKHFERKDLHILLTKLKPKLLMWTSAAAMILAISVMHASKNSDPLHVLLSVKCWEATCMSYREWDLSLPENASWPLSTGAQRSAISTMRGSKMDLYFQILGGCNVGLRCLNFSLNNCLKCYQPNTVKSLSAKGQHTIYTEPQSKPVVCCLSAFCRRISFPLVTMNYRCMQNLVKGFFF